MDTPNGEDSEKSISTPVVPTEASETTEEAAKPATAVCSEHNGSDNIDIVVKKELLPDSGDSNKTVTDSTPCDNTIMQMEEVKKESTKDEDPKNIPEENPKSETNGIDESAKKIEEKVEDNSVKQPSVMETRDLKRKRMSLSTQDKTSMAEDNSVKGKRKKARNTSDKFCWRCHKESVEAHCSACPRSWHRKCIGGMPPSSLDNWICGECVAILKAENAETRSPAMAQLSVDQLCMLLKHVVERMRDYPGSEPFWKAVDLFEVPNYMDYVIKPMDLSLLEANVHAKLYGSTDAFMADAKWIQHNCIVFNTCGGVYADTSKLTNAAKQIIKTARQEVSEIEACPDCFAHGRNLPRPLPSWFIEPCHRPHPLVWAKLKGFPFWPAKAMPRVNAQGHVDVRFFGAHDRAWVPPKDLYLYSEDPPAPLPRKRKLDMDECIKEITRHCRKLELVFGQFKFAPPKVQYDPNDPTQIKLMLPNYDPLQPSIIPVPPSPTLRRKTLTKKSIGPPKDKTKNSSPVAKVVREVSAVAESDKNTNKPQKVQKLNTPEKDTTVQTDLKTPVKEKSPEKMAEVKTEDETKVNDAATEETKSVATTNSGNTTPNNPQAPSPKVSDAKDSTHKIRPVERFVKHKTPKIELKIAQFPKKGSSVKGSPKSILQNVLSTPKATLKPIKSLTKVYKPKARMVDKLNAERALKTALENAANATNQVHIGSPNVKSPLRIPEASPQSPISHHPGKPTAKTDVASIKPSPISLLVNNGAMDSGRNPGTTRDVRENPDSSITIVKQEIPSSPRKESKAKKSFHNRPPDYPQPPAKAPPATNSVPLQDTVGTPFAGKHDGNGPYQLLPPEAGPLSSHLYKGAHELVRRMAQLMEEAYKEAAEESQRNEDANDTCQASVHFLRLQIERMRWQHQQQIAELKYNTDRLMREMRASLEAEKIRAVEETRREAEEEKKRCIEETKSKQWCAMCGREAMFYCCWNTAYCDYPCQKTHWSTHMRTCSQQPSFTTIVTSTAGNSNQQQVMPRLVINAQHATSNVRRT